MNEPHDPNETRDERTAASRTDPGDAANPTVDFSSLAAESLEVGLAAAFGKNPGPPRSSIGDMRPVLLKEAEGESCARRQADVRRHAVRETRPATATSSRGEIARGGMGAVLRGRDVDLGRDLAVKVLLEKYANRPDVARRFIEEAQIGGQLQHPGVVPVYDLGRFGDRPFFTMKLVKGQTLAAHPRRAHRPGRRSPAPAGHRLAGGAGDGLRPRQGSDPPRPEAGQHHGRGVRRGAGDGLGPGQGAGRGGHRRRRAGQPGSSSRAADETVIRTARSTGASGSFGTETEAGSVLGTPAYMPPEQASGDIANLDRRADVFGLVRILCEILTGKPPYVGRSSEEVRRKAANGDLADATARLDGCGADPELVALTKQCLSPEAIDRPKDAQVVVDALTSYLDGVQERLQKAERERAVAEAREHEERKRRKVQLALAASVLAMMLGIGAFAFWRNEQAQLVRQRDARNAEAVAGLLGQAEESLRAGDAAKAAVALEAAKKRSAEGGAEKEAKRLGRLDADLALLARAGRRRPVPLDCCRQQTARRRGRGDADPGRPETVRGRPRRCLGGRRGGTGVRVGGARTHRAGPGSPVAAREVDRRACPAKAGGCPPVPGLGPGFDPRRGPCQDRGTGGPTGRLGATARVRRLSGRERGDPGGAAAAVVTGGGEPTTRGPEPADDAGRDIPDQREGNGGREVTLVSSGRGRRPGQRRRTQQPGHCADEKGQLDEAIACYKKAIELDPKHAIAHSTWALR